jgi:hypothetical protein
VPFRSFLALILAAVLLPADAKGQVVDLGGRLGLRLGPDQVVLGGHGSLWTPTDATRLVGVATLGFGDDVTILDLAADFHFVFRESPLAQDTYFYVGAGPDFSNAWASAGGETAHDADLGITILGGVEVVPPGRMSWFGEFRARLDDRDEWIEVHLGFRLAE